MLMKLFFVLLAGANLLLFYVTGMSKDVEEQQVCAREKHEEQLQLQKHVARQHDVRMDVDVCVDAGDEQQAGCKTERESEHAPRNQQHPSVRRADERRVSAAEAVLRA